MTTALLNGKDFNFYKQVTVTDTNFPTDAQVDVNIRNQSGIYLINYDSTQIVSFSFNRTTTHGTLRPGTPSAALMFDGRRVSHIWLKTDAGSPIVEIAAWAGI